MLTASAMKHAVPTRFRDPLCDPDPVVVRQYRSLMGEPPAIAEGQAATLAEALTRGDPLADGWLEEHGRTQEGRTLLEQALIHGIEAVPEAPASLRALFRQLECVPLWLDPAALLLGARTFRRTGMLGQLVLADFGLMAGYGSSAVVKPLVMTGQLTANTAERLINTGRFVTQVTEPGALTPGREGYRAAVHVRLVHAAVRRALAHAPAWRHADWGLPINQADMLATNLLFSIGVVEGCRKLGAAFREDEVDALVHLWRYVGHLVGVDEHLLPSNGVALLVVAWSPPYASRAARPRRAPQPEDRPQALRTTPCVAQMAAPPLRSYAGARDSFRPSTAYREEELQRQKAARRRVSHCTS